MEKLVYALIVIAIVALGPVATIIALNTLFGLNIEITLSTCMAAFWLAALVGGSSYKRNS